MRYLCLLCGLLLLPFIGSAQISAPGGGGSSSWNGGTVSGATIFANAADTAVTIKAGSTQSSNLLGILDNSSVLKMNVGWGSGYPYIQFESPANITTYGAFAISAIGDSAGRLKIGLDNGNPFLNFGIGSVIPDVGFERSSAGTVQVTAGGGLGFFGSMSMHDLTLNGTLTIPASGRTGNGAKLATSTGTLTTNDCVKIDASGNFIDAGVCGSGGAANYQTVQANGAAQTQRAKLNIAAGANVTVTPNDNGTDTTTVTIASSGSGSGASLFTQMKDFLPDAVTSSSIEFGAAATSSTPSIVKLGGAYYSYSNGVTLNKTAGTTDDLIYYYIDEATGNRTMGYSSVSNTYTCTGCEAATPVANITSFPATSYPLFTYHITAGVPDALTSTAYVDYRGSQSATPLKDGYGTHVATSGGLTSINSALNVITVSGTSVTFDDSYCGKYINFTNTGTVNATIPQAGLGNQLLAGCPMYVQNYAGTVIFTPTNSTINNGFATYTLAAGGGAILVSNPSKGANGAYDVFTSVVNGNAFNGGTITNALTINVATGSNTIALSNSSASQSQGILYDGLTQNWFAGSSNSTQIWTVFDSTAAKNAVSFSAGTEAATFTGPVTAPQLNTKPTRVTATGTAPQFAGFLVLDATSASLTETLYGTPLDGDVIIVKRADSSANTETLSAGAGKTIDGSASITLSAKQSVTLRYEAATSTYWIN